MSDQIKPFPSAKHRRIVEFVARRMAGCLSMDDAQAELVKHLQVHWDHLEAFGVGDEDVELECIRFAKAAWDRWQQLQREAGAA
jgi:hypothetical protein